MFLSLVLKDEKVGVVLMSLGNEFHMFGPCLVTVSFSIFVLQSLGLKLVDCPVG